MAKDMQYVMAKGKNTLTSLSKLHSHFKQEIPVLQENIFFGGMLSGRRQF
jgi:hypothetical protein